MRRVAWQVCALLSGGGYAEKVAVPAGQVLPLPPGVSLKDAASFPEVVCTLWSTVFMRSRLSAGETFLIHGGSSGIGSAEKLAACKDLGADVCINYKTLDFVGRVKEETQGKGVDVVLDNMGGPYFQRNLDSLNVDGRLFIIGFMGGTVSEVNLTGLLASRLTVQELVVAEDSAGHPVLAVVMELLIEIEDFCYATFMSWSCDELVTQGGGLDDGEELVVGEGGEERAGIVGGELGGGGEEVGLLAVVVVVHGWDLWKDSGLECSATGLHSRSTENKALIVNGVEKNVWPAIMAGKVKPVVYKYLPLSEAAEGHRLMESSNHIGKILLVP
ncbi:hypothetical protein RHMOL_Rhmol05G0218100 [Rhododendron molle]|uniref:Uncharacterized protein n=1 Tax=Rhododendron molle TaxID=49168 RepID=A0ACC0NTS1_RHOML|nr:hypothetical protein RHMOL_Rhmol05G0218100 [Rhododendron molle]